MQEFDVPAVDMEEVEKAVSNAERGQSYIVLEGSTRRADVIGRILIYFDHPPDGLPEEDTEEEEWFYGEMIEALDDAAYEASGGRVTFGSHPADPALWGFWLLSHLGETLVIVDEQGISRPSYMDPDKWDALSKSVEEDKHLPSFLANNADAERLFRAIDVALGSLPTASARPFSSREAHEYVVTRFLPFMALHGWTLTRTNEEALNLKITVSESTFSAADAINMMIDKLRQIG